MEYAHRVLGRLIGLAFTLPLAYFLIRRRLPLRLVHPIPKALAPPAPPPNPIPAPTITPVLAGLALLIGAQGVLGWYMVKSGLADSLMETPGAVPRVSQYRLAAHLGLALALYVGMLGTGLTVLRDWKWANRVGEFKKGATTVLDAALKERVVRVFKARIGVLTALVLLTAVSGMVLICILQVSRHFLTSYLNFDPLSHRRVCCRS